MKYSKKIDKKINLLFINYKINNLYSLVEIYGIK